MNALSTFNGDLPVVPFAIGFPIFFVGLWVFITFIISRVGGWSTLAEHYRTQQPFFGTMIRFQAAQFRHGTNYNGGLNFGANSDGLYLVPLAIFRSFHPPLLIPWSDISTRPVKIWRIFDMVELRLQRAPNIPIRIRTALAAKLIEASVGRFNVTPTAPVGI